jgi:hypothetical protein
MRRAAVRAWRWLEADPQRALLLTIAAMFVIRAPFLWRPLEADEGGFLMVADQWDGGGTSLYGDQWVDRPPLLLLIFKVAATWGGSALVVHLFAAAFNALLICAAWWVGRIINDARGAVAAAVVAAVCGANLSIGGLALTGELMAGSLVMASCALILQARYRTEQTVPALALAVAAGVVATMAFLVKQNFIDAGLFAFALLVINVRQTWRLMLAFGAGIAIPLMFTGVWANTHGPGVVPLWNALFRFRRRAFDIVTDAGSKAPLIRFEWLIVLFVVSGMLFLSWQLVVACRRIEHQRSLRLAVFVMWVYGVVGILVGASWWRHYLIALIPALAMGTALATRREARRLRTHYAATLAAGATVVATMVGITMMAAGWVPKDDEQQVAAYLREASDPGDGIFIAYGAPDLIWKAGLHAPYRYSWSLPMRARDPHLKGLVATLRGPEAPTWLVEVGDFNWWRIDNPRFEAVRADRYHRVATVCGHDIYLLDGVVRANPPVPTTC